MLDKLYNTKVSIWHPTLKVHATRTFRSNQWHEAEQTSTKTSTSSLSKFS